MKFILLTYILLFPPVITFAQSFNLQPIQPNIGGGSPPSFYELPDGMDLRATAPTGSLLSLPGGIVTTVPPAGNSSIPYVILGKRDVRSGFTLNTWANIAPVTRQGQLDPSGAGWVLLPDNSQPLAPFNNPPPDLTHDFSNYLSGNSITTFSFQGANQ